jgi:acetyl esterase
MGERDVKGKCRPTANDDICCDGVWAPHKSWYSGDSMVIRRWPAICAAAIILLFGAASAGIVTGGFAPSQAGASAAITSIDNVPYSNASAVNDLDIVEPSPNGQNQMAVVLIHGGGYTTGSKSGLTPEADEFAESGIVAFNINYRLDGYPNESNDAMTAVAWVRSNATTYGVNPNDIAVFGASAGGTLAAMVATEGAANGAPVRAAISWSGPMDLAALVNDSTPGSYAYEHPETYVGNCSPSQCPATYAAASPVDHVTSQTAPMLLANSTNEEIPLNQAQEMDNALKAAGVPQQLDVIPGTQHATDYNDVEISPTIQFISQYLEAQSTSPASQPAPSSPAVASPAPTTTTLQTSTTTTTTTIAPTTTTGRSASIVAADSAGTRHANTARNRGYLAIAAAVVVLAIVGILAGVIETRNRNRKRLLLTDSSRSGGA